MINILLSIAFPLIIFTVALVYFSQAIRAHLRGEFEWGKTWFSRVEYLAQFRWYVWGRFAAGIMLLIVSLSFAIVFHRS